MANHYLELLSRRLGLQHDVFWIDARLLRGARMLGYIDGNLYHNFSSEDVIAIHSNVQLDEARASIPYRLEAIYGQDSQKWSYTLMRGGSDNSFPTFLNVTERAFRMAVSAGLVMPCEKSGLEVTFDSMPKLELWEIMVEQSMLGDIVQEADGRRVCIRRRSKSSCEVVTLPLDLEMGGTPSSSIVAASSLRLVSLERLLPAERFLRYSIKLAFEDPCQLKAEARSIYCSLLDRAADEGAVEAKVDRSMAELEELRQQVVQLNGEKIELVWKLEVATRNEQSLAAVKEVNAADAQQLKTDELPVADKHTNEPVEVERDKGPKQPEQHPGHQDLQHVHKEAASDRRQLNSTAGAGSQDNPDRLLKDTVINAVRPAPDRAGADSELKALLVQLQEERALTEQANRRAAEAEAACRQQADSLAALKAEAESAAGALEQMTRRVEARAEQAFQCQAQLSSALEALQQEKRSLEGQLAEAQKGVAERNQLQPELVNAQNEVRALRSQLQEARRLSVRVPACTQDKEDSAFPSLTKFASSLRGFQANELTTWLNFSDDPHEQVQGCQLLVAFSEARVRGLLDYDVLGGLLRSLGLQALPEHLAPATTELLQELARQNLDGLLPNTAERQARLLEAFDAYVLQHAQSEQAQQWLRANPSYTQQCLLGCVRLTAVRLLSKPAIEVEEGGRVGDMQPFSKARHMALDAAPKKPVPVVLLFPCFQGVNIPALCTPLEQLPPTPSSQPPQAFT